MHTACASLPPCQVSQQASSGRLGPFSCPSSPVGTWSWAEGFLSPLGPAWSLGAAMGWVGTSCSLHLVFSSTELLPQCADGSPAHWPTFRGTEHHLTSFPGKPRYVMVQPGSRRAVFWSHPCPAQGPCPLDTLLVLAQPKAGLARRCLLSAPCWGPACWWKGTPVEEGLDLGDRVTGEAPLSPDAPVYWS